MTEHLDDKIFNIKDVSLEVGKLYEYTGKYQRPMMQKPRGRYISTWSNSMLNPGDAFMLLETLPKTISYLKICVISSGRVGWFYTGFTNRDKHFFNKKDKLSTILNKLI
jgi:hypothetical protein